MLFRRRLVLAGLFSPIVPMASSEDAGIIALGADLDARRSEVAALEIERFDPAGWTRWNKAMEVSISLARTISRTPAGDVLGFAVKMQALAWELHDDLEEHQLERLETLANEMRRASLTG